MIKNIVTISLIVFSIVIVAILGAGVFLNQGKTNISPAVQQNNTNTSGSISSAELTKHNTPSDCWLIVSGKVYNVTDYINMHPAGPETITPYCGKDATAAFDTRNGRGPHSQGAQDALNNYYVGNFGR